MSFTCTPSECGLVPEPKPMRFSVFRPSTRRVPQDRILSQTRNQDRGLRPRRLVPIERQNSDADTNSLKIPLRPSHRTPFMVHLKCRKERLQLTKESRVYEQMKERESYLLVGIARSTKFFHRTMTWICGSVIPIDLQARSMPLWKSHGPRPQFSECSESANTSLLRADQFVGHTAPADSSRNQRIHKIYEV